MTVEQCADQAIDNFAKQLGNGYYPDWNGLVPTDPNSGWGATAADWRTQAADIISDFEKCAGVNIGFNRSEIDTMGTMTLGDFSDYLAEKAEESSARFVANFASAHLQTIRAKRAKSGVLTRAAPVPMPVPAKRRKRGVVAPTGPRSKK